MSGDQKKSESKSHWRQSINGGFNFNRINNDLLNPFPTLGGQLNVHNYNANFGYNLSKSVFQNSLRFNYNRNNITIANQFTGLNNIESQLGINGVSQLASDFGLPILNFAPEFSGLSDTSPQQRNNQNYTLGDTMNDTDRPFGLPANNYDLRSEWGRAAQDLRHRFLTGVNFRLPWGVSITAWTMSGSSRSAGSSAATRLGIFWRSGFWIFIVGTAS